MKNRGTDLLSNEAWRSVPLTIFSDNKDHQKTPGPHWVGCLVDKGSLQSFPLMNSMSMWRHIPHALYEGIGLQVEPHQGCSRMAQVP